MKTIRFPQALAATVLALGAAAGHAALDASAATDDHSINKPTSWWTYTNIAPADLAARLSDNKARLVDLEVISTTSTGEPRFVARMVPNSGSYAVPGWWWYYDQTPAQIANLLTANGARLIEMERYVRADGQERYAVVMVSNTGSAARAWTYLIGATASSLTTFMTSNGMRPIDLDSVGSGSGQRFNAVMVSNTGADAKPFIWGYGQSPSSIASQATSFQGRVVKLDRQADGRYTFVQVKNTGSDGSAWWHRYGFASMTDVNNYALQFAARPVDVVSYTVNNVRYYDAAFIDNANTSTRRMRGEMAAFVDGPTQTPKGIFESYLKPIGGSPVIDLNSGRRVETASAFKAIHLLWQMKQVQAGTDTLGEAFDYYNYPGSGDLEDRCPDPGYETPSSRVTTTVQTAMAQMMNISDNRTTRGVVLRAGGFGPLNTLAAQSGLTGTTLRHNIGCAYGNPASDRYTPSTMRNDTTAADLVRVYEGVWQQTLLNNTNNARNSYLNFANPGTGGWDEINAIIQQEAAAQGKSAIASSFAAQLRRYSKSGGYGTCLGDPLDTTQCGQKVVVYSWAGLLGMPRKSSTGTITLKWYGFSTIVSDVPVDDWNSPTDVVFQNAYNKARIEIFRDEIRSALTTW